MHWFAASTSVGPSIYSPVDAAVYDDTTGYTSWQKGNVSADGYMVFNGTSSGIEYINVYNNMFGIDADGGFLNMQTAANQAGVNELPLSNAPGYGRPVFLENASLAHCGAPQIWIPSDEGVLVLHYDPVTAGENNGIAGWVRLNENYASPYMKGDMRGAWPLCGLDDVSPAGHTLTNNNTVTFSDGGPAGSYANFVAASSQSLCVADHADFGAMCCLSFGAWVYRDIDGTGTETIISKWDSASDDDSFTMYVHSGGTIGVHIDTADGEASMNSSNFSDMELARWWYLAVNVRRCHDETVYRRGV